MSTRDEVNVSVSTLCRSVEGHFRRLQFGQCSFPQQNNWQTGVRRYWESRLRQTQEGKRLPVSQCPHVDTETPKSLATFFSDHPLLFLHVLSFVANSTSVEAPNSSRRYISCVPITRLPNPMTTGAALERKGREILLTLHNGSSIPITNVRSEIAPKRARFRQPRS